MPYNREKNKKSNFLLVVPANKVLFAGTVPANKVLFSETVPANKVLFARTVPANNSIHKDKNTKNRDK